MVQQSSIIVVVAEDYYQSETLEQYIYSFHCPQCQTWGFVTQEGDVVRCECGSFLKIVVKK